MKNAWLFTAVSNSREQIDNDLHFTPDIFIINLGWNFVQQ